MENNQSTQQSSKLGDSKLTRSSRRKTVLLDNLNSLLALLKKWPWLIWSGVWVLLLALSALAILSLTHPISVEQEEPEPKPIAAETTEKRIQTGSIPLWLVSAAALTFAAGSLVIFKRLNSSSQSNKLRRRSSGQAVTRRQQRKLLLQGHSSAPTSLEPLSPTAPMMPAEIEPVVLLPPEESHSFDSGEESLAEMLDDCSPFSASENLIEGNYLNAESEPVVTVLPPEESHLGDSGEESLAEMMDIRKHRSLASILQNSKE